MIVKKRVRGRISYLLVNQKIKIIMSFESRIQTSLGILTSPRSSIRGKLRIFPSPRGYVEGRQSLYRGNALNVITDVVKELITGEDRISKIVWFHDFRKSVLSSN